MFKPLFHLAYHVDDLKAAAHFYGHLLGCRRGRSTETWIDFDFFGHQISLHLGKPFATAESGKVGDHMVPMPHLGAVLPLEIWREIADRLTATELEFVIEPTVRFEGQPGEQWTMFFRDPAGNPIELKGFANEEAVWAA
ncbi:VOC family protein [Fulvimarina sp. MAC8]|uniref:VOC family protein n=1 Tax=Fulvimarina sp. MAC8 TaxID=3162874 RepID=UPI0032F03F68